MDHEEPEAAPRVGETDMTDLGVVNAVSRGFHGQEISWVGHCPWTGKVCFGTEDGVLILTVSESNFSDKPSYGIQVFKDETINGVAFSGDFVAISSRNEVAFAMRVALDHFQSSSTEPSFSLNRMEPSFTGGAHGVVASRFEGFIAPIGVDGLLHIRLNGEQLEFQVGRVDEKMIDFYKLITLDGTSVGEVLACAARESGLLAIETTNDLREPSIVAHQIDGLDVIDVCSLNSSLAPRAVVALERDGGLLWTKDVLERKPPLLMRFEALTGTGYSVLSAQGHVFLLTSTELVTLPNLANDFLSGVPMNRLLAAKTIPIEALDIFLVDNATMYVIGADGEFSLHLSDLVAGIVGTHGELVADPTPAVSFVPTIIEREWSTTEMVFGELVGA